MPWTLFSTNGFPLILCTSNVWNAWNACNLAQYSPLFWWIGPPSLLLLRVALVIQRLLLRCRSFIAFLLKGLFKLILLVFAIHFTIERFHRIQMVFMGLGNEILSSAFRRFRQTQVSLYIIIIINRCHWLLIWLCYLRVSAFAISIVFAFRLLAAPAMCVQLVAVHKRMLPTIATSLARELARSLDSSALKADYNGMLIHIVYSKSLVTNVPSI